MRFTVVLTPVAEYQLASIWLSAPDRQNVTNVFDGIERGLRDDPRTMGRDHPGGWKVIARPPLVVSFTVSEDDRLVKILSLKYQP